MSGLFALRGLRVELPFGARDRAAVVDDLTLEVRAGECLGVVGESGCGKSISFLAALGLAPAAARVSGSARLDDIELIGASQPILDRLRGRRIGMVFQDPDSLTPHMRIGEQLIEPLLVHHGLSRARAWQRARERLAELQMADPERRLRQYPHELSGGMRQRVMLAMALIGEPAVLIADEPTTALDVTVQAQLLSLLQRLRAERGLAIVLISHDFGVVAQLCERVAVMYAGRIVEQGSARRLLTAPAHPYTRALLASIPRRDSPLGVPLPAIPGQPAPLGDWSGCAFRDRCPQVHERCHRVSPELRPGPAPDQYRRCHLEAPAP